MAKVSTIVDSIQMSAVSSISIKASEKGWDDTIFMAGGEPQFSPPSSVNKAFSEIVEKGYNKYSPFAGYSSLLQKIKVKLRDFNNIHVNEEQIYTVPGGSSALFTALMTLIEKGDEVLIQDPCWEHYAQIINLLGGVAKKVKMVRNENGHLRVDREILEKSITDKTKVLLLNTPLNPTGSVLTTDEIKDIVEVVEKYDIHLVADEEYEGFVFDPYKHISPAAIYPKTITLFSFSKTYALTGIRLGYIVAPEDIINAIRKVSLYSFMYAPSPSQYVAEAVLSDNHIEFAKRACQEMFEKSRYLSKSLQSIPGVLCDDTESGLYVNPNFSNFRISGIEMSELLFERYHLLSVPGEVSGENGKGSVRLYVGLDQKVLEEAVKRIRSAVEQLSLVTN
ncbi:pyridoxal phosphate-dependent aminotransferase [Cytobacillus firmus]|uniref:Aminotransferase n=1 Tax=Cytobacillus firmus TaxID=1399 RepID=A0A800NB36_CYTFI|nr:pyridoxal phosphate-dependent aminotransferase [Cytobacillus firmus]KAF0824289.1 Aspartate aminotransferase [Cytobacillus firmus]